MDAVYLEIIVNKVNTQKVLEAATANNGTIEDRTTAHALADTEEPRSPLAEKVIDHDILRFTFESEETATTFVEAAAAVIGVTPALLKGTMTTTRNGEKFDLAVSNENQAEIKQG